MPKVAIKRKLRLTRQEVSERLIALGNALADGSEIELSSGGDSIELAVGDSIEWELEIDIDGDQTEVEIELKWKDNPQSDKAAGSDAPSGTDPAVYPETDDSDADADDSDTDDSDTDDSYADADDSDADADAIALEVTAIEELGVAAELEEDAEIKLEIAAELEQEAAAELMVAAALQDDAEVELETAELLEVETLVAGDNPLAGGEAEAGSEPAK